MQLYEKAELANDQAMVDFCNAIFDVYDESKVDSNTPRPSK